MKRVPIVYAVWLTSSISCAPSLTREMITQNPRITFTSAGPQIVERSAPLAPAWTMRAEPSGAAYVAFSGYGAGASLDSARALAERDLMAAVSGFVTVDVESRSEYVTSEESVAIRSSITTRSRSELRGVRTEDTYWEKVLASPLSSDVSYRCHVLARVPRSEIDRTKRNHLAVRATKINGRILAVLPFRAILSSGDAPLLGRAFIEALAHDLASEAGVHVSDPSLVDALAAGTSEAEALERVREALLPDVVVSGAYQVHAGRVRVSFTLYSSEGQRTRVIEKRSDEIASLEADLAAAIRGEIGAPSSLEPRRHSFASAAAYEKAFALFRAGNNEGAIAEIERAIRIEPRTINLQLRLGHVLERVGRYGLVPPRKRPPSTTSWIADACTPWAEITPEAREEFVKPEAPVFGDAVVAAPVDTETNVDHVFSAARFLMAGGPMPEPSVRAVPDSAAGAYWNALRLAVEDGDALAKAEAGLALGDLALRVDRLSEAEELHRAVFHWAASQGNLHFRSLAGYGLARSDRARGAYDRAHRTLVEALRDREILGEKPYLLEIHNELGAVAIERGEYKWAFECHRRALRIAEELNDDYFRAVLANNLGVLLVLLGRSTEAEPYFQRAWDYLRDLDEREGQVSTALNVAQLAGTKGDHERARSYLHEAHRLVYASALEGRMGEVYDQRAALVARRGQAIESLRDLIRAWSLFHVAGREPDALRVRANIAVADWARTLEGDLPRDAVAERLACVQRTIHAVLESGYGEDRTGLFERVGQSDPAWSRGHHEAKPVVRSRGLSFLYTTLNARTLAEILP
jgi:tetratricopeptide (TPR) repeat protein